MELYVEDPSNPNYLRVAVVNLPTGCLSSNGKDLDSVEEETLLGQQIYKVTNESDIIWVEKQRMKRLIINGMRQISEKFNFTLQSKGETGENVGKAKRLFESVKEKVRGKFMNLPGNTREDPGRLQVLKEKIMEKAKENQRKANENIRGDSKMRESFENYMRSHSKTNDGTPTSHPGNYKIVPEMNSLGGQMESAMAEIVSEIMAGEMPGVLIKMLMEELMNRSLGVLPQLERLSDEESDAMSDQMSNMISAEMPALLSEWASQMMMEELINQRSNASTSRNNLVDDLTDPVVDQEIGTGDMGEQVDTQWIIDLLREKLATLDNDFPKLEQWSSPSKEFGDPAVSLASNFGSLEKQMEELIYGRTIMGGSKGKTLPDRMVTSSDPVAHQTRSSDPAKGRSNVNLDSEMLDLLNSGKEIFSIIQTIIQIMPTILKSPGGSKQLERLLPYLERLMNLELKVLETMSDMRKPIERAEPFLSSESGENKFVDPLSNTKGSPNYLVDSGSTPITEWNAFTLNKRPQSSYLENLNGKDLFNIASMEVPKIKDLIPLLNVILKEIFHDQSCAVPPNFNEALMSLSIFSEEHEGSGEALGTPQSEDNLVSAVGGALVAGVCSCRMKDLETAAADGRLAKTVTTSLKLALQTSGYLVELAKVLKLVMTSEDTRDTIGLLRWAAQHVQQNYTGPEHRTAERNSTTSTNTATVSSTNTPTVEVSMEEVFKVASTNTPTDTSTNTPTEVSVEAVSAEEVPWDTLESLRKKLLYKEAQKDGSP